MNKEIDVEPICTFIGLGALMTQKNDPPVNPQKIEGRYANYFQVGFNAFEFLIDFGQHYPEGEEAHLHTRIITNPMYVKALFNTLQESIQRYEEIFGLISDEDEK
jgi:hypothetical protein